MRKYARTGHIRICIGSSDLFLTIQNIRLCVKLQIFVHQEPWATRYLSDKKEENSSTSKLPCVCLSRLQHIAPKRQTATSLLSDFPPCSTSGTKPLFDDANCSRFWDTQTITTTTKTSNEKKNKKRHPIFPPVISCSSEYSRLIKRAAKWAWNHLFPLFLSKT